MTKMFEKHLSILKINFMKSYNYINIVQLTKHTKLLVYFIRMFKHKIKVFSYQKLPTIQILYLQIQNNLSSFLNLEIYFNSHKIFAI